MHMARLLVLVLTVGIFLSPATARELWERDWIEVRSPNFQVLSGIGEKRTRALVEEMEYFRLVVAMMTNIGRFEERVPTRIYLLPEKSAELGLKGNIAGLMRPTMRENQVVLAPSGDFMDEVLKHEYLHFLIHNRDHLLYPPWFDEGFAELLSTLRARQDRFDLGQVTPMRSESLRGAWMPFEKLLEARSTRDFKGDWQQMFYAQSWLLVHYLVTGRPGRDFAAENRVYLELLRAGEPPVPAFEQAFGEEVRKLGMTLRNYGRRMKYMRASLKQPFPAPAIVVSSVPGHEVAARLAQVALTSGARETAQRWVSAALAAAPANPQALVVQGDLHKFAGRMAEAEPFFLQAIEREPGNPLHELDYAEYLLDRAVSRIRAGGGDEEAAEDFRRARAHFSRSYQLDPALPETLAMNGATYLAEGISPEKAVASLEAANELLPSNTSIRMMLAQAYQANGQADAARKQLRSLLAWSHGDLTSEISELLADLEDKPPGTPEAGTGEPLPASP